jgi:formylmethanofuran dehydrogenase subunit C
VIEAMLRLVYKAQTSVPVEIEGLVPQAIRSQSPAQIERFEIFHGNEKRPLADYFAVSGDPADGRIEFEGELAGVHWIGAHMTEGTIHVAGNAGRHLGSEMTGGEIHVAGDAGDWVGGEMHGGLIHVRGRAGHLAGSAYRGSRRGMTGGTILIHGETGNEIGHTMRRGLLAVGGCGDFVGINMIAGTILVFGPCGIRPGAGMRRGTIGLFGDKPPTLLPTFRAGSRDKLLVLELIFRELRRLDYPVPDQLVHCDYRMYHGDLVTVGRGEVLVPEFSR